MAVDEAIFEGVQRGGQPALRLYSWEPACLSLGYAQPFGDVDLDALNQRGWQVVRRVTGGRAILHGDELTYSVMAPDGEPRVAGDLLASYRRISGALLLAVNKLQVAAEAKNAEKADSPREQPVCFEAPSSYEILAGGKKLIGSAQARRKGGVLQHGTLPLFGDLKRIVEVLHFRDRAERQQAGERLMAQATTVEDATGRRVSWESAAQAFVDAFQEQLHIQFVEGGLSEGELERVGELVRTKYSQEAWTKRN